MRILFLSNYYPPYAIGGYEQCCQDVATELAHRGHQVSVLTSRSPDGGEIPSGDGVEIKRLLHLEVETGLLHSVVRLLRHRRRIELENLAHMQQLAVDFRPDAVLIWGMWNVPRSVPALAEQLLPSRVAYFLCDYWPSLPSAHLQQWQSPSKRTLTRWPKALIRRAVMAKLAKEPMPILHLRRPICVSEAVRDLLVRSGLPVDNASIVHGGIRIGDFMAASTGTTRHARSNGLKLLYAGRLASEKGVHTAIRALVHTAWQADRPVTLDIVGDGNPGYISELKALTKSLRLEGRVSFRRGVPRRDMPALLAQYDALVFPSEWEEPFARIVLEAMAAGLVVVGTTTGGTGDVLVDGETGLTFPGGDAKSLAAQIGRLLYDPELGRQLVVAGRQRVATSFTLERTVDEMESLLYDRSLA